MESLIDKIIDKLIARKDEQHNPIVRREFESAIEEIKEIEREAEFEEAARVLIKHLNNPQYHPHFTVVVNSTFAELSEGRLSTGKIMDYVID